MMSLVFSAVMNWFRIAGRASRMVKRVVKEPDALNVIKSELDTLVVRLSATDQDIFLRAAGGALTAWAKMEEQLVLLLAVLLGIRATKAGIILYSIINFNVWLSIIDELFSLDSPYSQFEPRWNKLHARLRKDKDNRDRLAHHPIYRETDKSQAMSRPSRFDVRQKSKSFRPLSIDQVIDFRARIIRIAEDLASLIEEMLTAAEAAATSPEKFVEPNPHQSK